MYVYFDLLTLLVLFAQGSIFSLTPTGGEDTIFFLNQRNISRIVLTYAVPKIQYLLARFVVKILVSSYCNVPFKAPVIEIFSHITSLMLEKREYNFRIYCQIKFAVVIKIKKLFTMCMQIIYSLIKIDIPFLKFCSASCFSLVKMFFRWEFFFFIFVAHLII